MRLGGDEFVVHISNPEVVAQAQQEGVASILLPLKERLKKIDIPQLRFTPSLSCGAVFVQAGSTRNLQDIYELADKKLYEAKKTHNGNVESAEI